MVSPGFRCAPLTKGVCSVQDTDTRDRLFVLFLNYLLRVSVNN